MSVIARVTTWSDGQTLTASALNGEFNNILNDYNGSITNANISATAAIAYSKLSLTGSIVNADLAGSISASKITNTAVTLSDSQTISGNNSYTGKSTFAQVVQTVTSLSPAGAGTATLNLALGNVFTITVPAGNITIALSNAQTGQFFLVRFINDSSVRTLTWFTTIKWPGGSAPALTGSSKIDTFGFQITGSNTYDGFIVGQNLS